MGLFIVIAPETDSRTTEGTNEEEKMRGGVRRQTQMYGGYFSENLEKVSACKGKG